MVELRVSRSESKPDERITISNGRVGTPNEELADVVGEFTDMEIMVGERPVKANDTPAEKFKPATDDEIAATLTGILRTRGWGVVYSSK